MSTEWESEQEGQPQQGLQAAASEFRRNVQEATERLNSAAEQFMAVSDGLVSAINEARQAAERAQEAQRAVEAMQQQMARDYGSVSDLVRDLQERIGALATLARPLGTPETPSMPEQGQGESQPQGGDEGGEAREPSGPSW
jgi:chromosome segregation ATPase